MACRGAMLDTRFRPLVRARYDKRGRITGYSGGPGTYYWFQMLGLVFLLLIVVPILLLLLATLLVCLVGFGISRLIGKDGDGWRSAAQAVLELGTRFGHWSDRQQR